jgi:hypothetical protein
MPWVLITFTGRDHALAPEVYPYKWRARTEAQRFAEVFPALGLSESSTLTEERELTQIAIRVVALDAPSELSHPVFIGSGWAPDGYVSPEAVLLMTAIEAEEWVTGGADATSHKKDDWSFHYRLEDGTVRVASIAKLVS